MTKKTAMADWYVEAAPEESWRKVSRLFAGWLQENAKASLDSFGYSEGDSLIHGGKNFLCFSIPSQHGDKANLFGAWAKTTARAHGRAEDGVVALNTGERIVLPPAPEHKVPPWLKNP